MTARYKSEDPDREKYMAAEQDKLAQKKTGPEWQDLTAGLDEVDEEDEKQEKAAA